MQLSITWLADLRGYYYSASFACYLILCLGSFFGHDAEREDDVLSSDMFGGDMFGGFAESHFEGHTGEKIIMLVVPKISILFLTGSQSCKTVTKKVGNTITTYTTCT